MVDTHSPYATEQQNHAIALDTPLHDTAPPVGPWFQPIRGTRNETDARHLLSRDVVGISELFCSLSLLSDDRSRGVGVSAAWTPKCRRRRCKWLRPMREWKEPHT